MTSRAVLMTSIALIVWGVLAGTSPNLPRKLSAPFGRVVDPSGKPVASARVTLIRHELEPAVIEEVSTDDEGRFVFQAEVRPIEDEPSPKILARAPGFGPGFVDFVEWKNGSDLRLAEEATLRGTVKGPKGEALSNLTVTPRIFVVVTPAPEVEPDPNDRRPIPTSKARFVALPTSVAETLSATTNAEGRYVLRGMPQGARVQLRHRDARFSQLTYSNEARFESGAKEYALDLTLKAGATARGRVLDAAGKPVAGVRVNAQGAERYEGWGSSLTDADGAYEIGSLPPGTYNIGLDLSSGLSKDWAAAAFADLVLGSGEVRAALDFRLVPGVLVTGRVSDTGGKPIAGMYVGIYGPARPRSGAWVQSAKTGPDGKYVLRVPPGKQFVYLMGGPVGDPDDQQGKDIDVEDGKSAVVDFKNVVLHRN